MKTWPISYRIILGFGITVLCMACVSYLSIASMQSVSNHLATASKGDLPVTQQLTSFERELLNARINFIYYVTIQKPGALDKGWERYHNAEKVQRDLIELTHRQDDLHDLQAPLLKLHADLDTYGTALAMTLDMVKQGTRQGPLYDAQVKDWAAKGANLVTDAGMLQTLCSKRSTTSTDRIADGIQSSTQRCILLFLFGTVVCIALATYTVRHTNRLLHDGIAELFESVAQVAAAANEVDASSRSLAQDSSQQAATIEEASAASLQVSSMAQRATEYSSSATHIVNSSQQNFGSANLALIEMVGAMDSISTSGEKISKVIKVIDGIAFQTNILALNAAVEAARAGQAGLGFAVVAEEVRNLAQRSARGAKDTADLIQESIQNAADGRAKVERVANTIRSITEESTRIKGLVHHINQGSIAQSHGIDRIGSSIAIMAGVSQSSVAAAHQGAAAAQQLHTQVQNMKDSLGRLQSLVEKGA